MYFIQTKKQVEVSHSLIYGMVDIRQDINIDVLQVMLAMLSPGRSWKKLNSQEHIWISPASVMVSFIDHHKAQNPTFSVQIL
jgi:hypothetical protein